MDKALQVDRTGYIWIYGTHNQVMVEGKDYDYIFWQGNMTPVDGGTVCKGWITDNDGRMIFENDIRKDSEGRCFRIYNFDGVFCIKAHYWMENTADLQPTDELILEALIGQPRAWVLQSTTHVKNIYDK